VENARVNCWWTFPQGLISPTWLQAALLAKKKVCIKKINSSVSFWTFGICKSKSCLKNVGEIDPRGEQNLFRGWGGSGQGYQTHLLSKNTKKKNDFPWKSRKTYLPGQKRVRPPGPRNLPWKWTSLFFDRFLCKLYPARRLLFWCRRWASRWRRWERRITSNSSKEPKSMATLRRSLRMRNRCTV